MNINEWQQNKTAFLKDFLNHKNTDSFEQLVAKVQEKSPQLQNNKFRSSTPWNTLIRASESIPNDISITLADEALDCLRIDSVEGQNIFNAAFMKQVNYISDDMEIDLQETAELIYDYLKEKKVNRKSLTEIIKELKKLSSNLLEIT
jgi:hypothetical protein